MMSSGNVLTNGPKSSEDDEDADDDENHVQSKQC